jgi:predicted amidohydrolase
MKIAVYQAKAVKGNVAKNLDLVRRQAEVAASRRVILVVFQRCS